VSDLLPPNATAQERALSLASGRDVATPVRDVWDPDTCPAALLAWLAWAFSVDEWDSTWTDAQKREVIKAAAAVHRYKGTIGAVQEALGALFVGARVQEWFNQLPAGDPYTFRMLLEVDQVGIDQAGVGSLFKVIERTKNLRSHLDEIELIVKSPAGLTMAAYTNVGCEIAVTNYVPGLLAANPTTICF
jgi:phage tail P2-like protein